MKKIITFLVILSLMPSVALAEKVKRYNPVYFCGSTETIVSLPGTIVVGTTDGEETESVVWDENNIVSETESMKIISGKSEDGEQVKAIVDFYDSEKESSNALTEKYIASGSMGGISALGHNLTRGEAAKLLFRSKIGKINIDFTDFTDADFNRAEWYIYATIMNDGFADNFAYRTFNENTLLTRLQAAEMLILVQNYLGLPERVRFSELPYTDIDDLLDGEKYILKKAYNYGIIPDETLFRPDESVSLDEFLGFLDNVIVPNELISVSFEDNGDILRNPGMGLFSYQTSNSYIDYDVEYYGTVDYREIPGLTTTYIRLPWSVFEPSEDNYDFSYIDTTIEKYKKLGIKVALRISPQEYTGYGTPKWVFDKGAEYYQSGEMIVPAYHNKIFLAEYEDFIAELAKRYDGNENIAYVDVGLGLWGEGYSGIDDKPISKDAVLSIIDIYAKYFKSTKCMLMTLTWHIDSIKDYAIEKGFGYRNDSFLVSSGDPINRSDGFWQKAPVVMETGHYSNSVSGGYWDMDKLYNYVKEYHASYLGLHGDSMGVYGGNADGYDKISRILGYRIYPANISLSAKAQAHGYLSLDAQWTNVGVARCYDGAYPQITLKDSKGNIISVMTDTSFNVSEIEPSASKKHSAKFKLNDNVPGGTYEAYISLGNNSGGAEIKMPIEGFDGENRYYLGKVHISGDYVVRAANTDPSTGKIGLSFATDINSADYNNLYPRITLKNVNGTMTHPMNIYEYSATLTEAIAAKSSVRLEYQLPWQFPGQWNENTYYVYYCMKNSITNSPYDGYMLGDGGRNTLIGIWEMHNNTAYFTPCK